MNRWEWEEEWHEEDETLPSIGQYIQLQIGQVGTNEIKIVEGTVSEVDNGWIDLIPNKGFDDSWGWIRWRGRIIPDEGLIEEEKRKRIDVIT